MSHSPHGVDDGRFSLGARYGGDDPDAGDELDDVFRGWGGENTRAPQQRAATAPVLGPVGVVRPPPTQPSYRQVDMGRTNSRGQEMHDDDVGDPRPADHAVAVRQQPSPTQPQPQRQQGRQAQRSQPRQQQAPTRALPPPSAPADFELTDGEGDEPPAGRGKGDGKKGKKKPRKPVPKLGVLILAGCCAGFAYSLYITPGIIAPLAVNPLIGPTSDSLVSSGAKVACLINGPPQQWWRLVSPMWLHAGVIHLVTNMNMLAQLGFDLERQAGIVRFALIYIAGGVFSMVTSALFAPQSVTVGASGALFGLLGAYLAELITNCHLLSVKEGLCAFASLFFSIAINLAIGLLPFVDNFAHIGGLVGGMLLGFVTLLHTDRSGQLRCRQIVGACLAAIAYCVLLVGGIVLLWMRFDMVSSCPGCEYMSCVPAPWWSCDVANAAQLMYCPAEVVGNASSPGGSSGGRRVLLALGEALGAWVGAAATGGAGGEGPSCAAGGMALRHG